MRLNEPLDQKRKVGFNPIITDHQRFYKMLYILYVTPKLMVVLDEWMSREVPARGP
jgi:hypothetical protein